MPYIERGEFIGLGNEPGTAAKVTIDNGPRAALDLKGGKLINAVISGAVVPGGQVISGNVDATKQIRFYFDVSGSPIVLKLQYSTDSGSTWSDVTGASWEVA